MNKNYIICVIPSFFLHLCNQEKEVDMSHTELNKLQFIIALIAEFADYYQLNKKQAFNYLKRFKEIEFFE
mgnify:CR=1 FL=1